MKVDFDNKCKLDHCLEYRADVHHSMGIGIRKENI